MPITLADRQLIVARMDKQFSEDLEMRRQLIKMEQRAKNITNSCRLYQKV